MRYAHLIFGIAVLLVFFVSGRFMRIDFPDKEMIAPEFRMLMRSRHIYILFSSLIHVLLGLYLQTSPQLWRRTLQLFGSVLLAAGSLFLIWAFVYESYFVRHFTDISRYGIYLSLAGTLFHLLSRTGAKR